MGAWLSPGLSMGTSLWRFGEVQPSSYLQASRDRKTSGFPSLSFLLTV